MKKRSARTKTRKSSPVKKSGKSFLKRNRTSRGRMGAGTLYFVVALLVIAFGGASMIGNIIPLSTSSPESGQAVMISPPFSETEKDNLQLFTFPGVTITATPPPPPPFQPDQRREGGDSSEWEKEKKDSDKGDGSGSGGSKPAGDKTGDGDKSKDSGKQESKYEGTAR